MTQAQDLPTPSMKLCSPKISKNKSPPKTRRCMAWLGKPTEISCAVMRNIFVKQNIFGENSTPNLACCEEKIPSNGHCGAAAYLRENQKSRYTQTKSQGDLMNQGALAQKAFFSPQKKQLRWRPNHVNLICLFMLGMLWFSFWPIEGTKGSAVKREGDLSSHASRRIRSRSLNVIPNLNSRTTAKQWY